MAALGTFRPGVHTATYNAVDLGLTTSAGWKLRWKPSKRKIQDTNAYGDTLIDGIFRGMTGVQLLVTLKEWKAAVKSSIWPYSVPSSPVFDGALGLIGQLDSAAAKPIVLTAQANSPAATNGPATLTASLAILAPENDIELLFGPDEHDIPVLFDLLLYDDSGAKRFFALT